MGVGQGVADFADDVEGFVNRQLAVSCEPIAKRFSFDVRHDVEQQPRSLTAVEQGQDVRVLERRGGLDLDPKPVGADDGRQLRPQYLERDLAVVLEVAGEVDGGHPALA